jgi:hypothetical protein
MITVKCILLLLLIAASLARAQEPAFTETTLDLTPSFLSSLSLQNASFRLASNIHIQKILPAPFLKKAVGYIALARLPVAGDVHPVTEYQCDLQLRYVKMQSADMQVFLFTGNTVNFGERTDISCDAGGGIRYLLGPQLYVSCPASFTLYPGGLMTTIEPGIVWHALSFSYHTANVLYQTAAMPAAGAYFVFGCRLSF